MKVKCISNYHSDYIVVGKIYETIDISSDEYYYIINEYNQLDYFSKNRFINWDIQYRSDRLKELLTHSNLEYREIPF